MKFGVSVERDQLNDIRSARPAEFFAFSSMAAFLSNAAGSKITTDLPGLVGPVEARAGIYGAYFQDDWRFRPNLTINLGMRYETDADSVRAQGKKCHPANYLRHNRNPASLWERRSPGVCNAQPDGLFKNNTLKDFSPRVGFAWDPQSDGKIRSAEGWFLRPTSLIAFMGSTSNANTARSWRRAVRASAVNRRFTCIRAAEIRTNATTLPAALVHIAWLNGRIWLRYCQRKWNIRLSSLSCTSQELQGAGRPGTGRYCIRGTSHKRQSEEVWS